MRLSGECHEKALVVVLLALLWMPLVRLVAGRMPARHKYTPISQPQTAFFVWRCRFPTPERGRKGHS